MTDSPLGSPTHPVQIAIVGSGPSAFYAAEALQKVGDLHCRIDMFDRLATPFGLVRGGVAPDHQKIKAVVKLYHQVGGRDGFRFFGNVMLGRDLQVEELTRHYHQVVFAVGCEGSRTLGVTGEDKQGIHSATEFVYWYNGHPDYQHLEFDLKGSRSVAVVGNGNVAMDVTRILIQDPERLASTDISDQALAALRESSVREVILLGRRGPAQAAFAKKEIHEIAKLEEVDVVVSEADGTIGPVSTQWLESGDAPKAAARNAEFLTAQVDAGEGSQDRKVRCRFRVSPIEFLGDSNVTGVRIQHSEMKLDDNGVPRPSPVEKFEDLDVDMVFKAIGYRGIPIPGVPSEDWGGTIPNAEGRVTDGENGAVVQNQYVVGWAKRGPTGLIGTNSPDSKATVAKMVEDLAGRTDSARDDIQTLLDERSIRYATFADWQRYDAWERAEGEQAQRCRRKLTDTGEILDKMASLR